MRKHRLRNRIKSLVGSHIDPDKDEELKGSNVETEDNYNKIIELLKDEDQDDKEKLVGLIEEFHKRYQSIYERYDHITGKLKEKVRSKKENDSSSSSSSDTDSDDQKSKNGKLENEIYTEIDELKRKVAAETEEKEAINAECEAAFKKLQETEEMFNESKLQSDRLREENSKLLADKRELETELSLKIEDINREKTSLMSEIETAMAIIEVEKRNNEELRAVVVQLKEEKDGFESELENIKEEFSKTKEKLKTTEEEVSNAIQILETSEAEKKSLSEELSRQREIHDSFKNETEIKMIGIEEELELLKSQKTEIEKRKEDEILALEKKSEDKESEINHLQVELESTRSQMDSLKLELANKAADEQKLLEETIEDLKSDLEIKGDEINSLSETVRNLEVKIRLANQKLRVTEQMLNETEHDHARREEKLHQENKDLTDKISTLSETIISVKKEVQENVHETLSIIDSLTVKFEEDYGHVTTRVSEIKNEIQAVASQVKRTRSEKDELKRKLEEMVVKLKMGESENEKLMKLLENKNEKIEEMENKIHLKDEEIMEVVQDKKEAIRQLCIWADYQRGRCDRLQELLGGGGSGGRRQTVR
ncbi:COP1-interactive protein 1 [Cynara cardunculus var. scolymus]|uniref:NAB domain-containing protein n=1 Tax=Cynara cardunculus var. scolymus TaxID=59895 RepID=A0A118JU09_CYNCS|nr:COP1-interactive protein 1 [Cynara cardunculus var. scolymus]XP_024995692.1 COP1-interactive protein 1 [Cynara cardunculus var. scolymus]XP_024995693.1 COP1-interactive protein 1 [Cynara cardunculus var. scolymus]KVH91822.1 hypothetical protein Ccrd_006152 [Cynara cardunculus var. scolymus]